MPSWHWCEGMPSCGPQAPFAEQSSAGAGVGAGAGHERADGGVELRAGQGRRPPVPRRAVAAEVVGGEVAAGAELADSWGFNPHKWMLVNFDCHALWVADRGTLIRSLSTQPDYLRNAASDAGAVIDYRDWQVPLGTFTTEFCMWS